MPIVKLFVNCNNLKRFFEWWHCLPLQDQTFKLFGSCCKICSFPKLNCAVKSPQTLCPIHFNERLKRLSYLNDAEVA